MLLHESFVHYIGYIIIGVSILLALWTIFDAQKRQMSNPTTWFLIVVILNVIGLVIYITQRPSLPDLDSDNDEDD